MSDYESDIQSISDISSFAAWEHTHGEKIPSEREISVADMADGTRVWEGADSSNDARSSGSESSDSEGGEVVVKVGKGLEGKKLGGGRLGRLGGKMEIPSSTADEDSQSQRRRVVEMEMGRFEVWNPLFN